MGDHTMPDVRQNLLNAIPRLRALAIGLCGHSAQADDLVQEALTRAWANLSSFQPGTNMEAWLYTILRNEFYTFLRKRRREVPDPEGAFAATLVSAPAQEGRVNFQELRGALARLTPPLREAILLVGASGLSYEDAAKACHCAVGTMKSRVHRARLRLMEMLDTFPPSADALNRDLSADPTPVPAGSGSQ